MLHMCHCNSAALNLILLKALLHFYISIIAYKCCVTSFFFFLIIIFIIIILKPTFLIFYVLHATCIFEHWFLAIFAFLFNPN